MENELLDYYDEHMNRIGTATRREVHEKGYWHQTFNCWIVTREDDKTYVLFQKRHPAKDTNPNKYDITSAGHLLAGESVADGVRELEEELGITARFEDLVPIGTYQDSLSFGGLIDRERCHIFLYECDLPLERYRPQLDEVVGLVRVRADEALRLFAGEAEAVEAAGLEWDEPAKEDAGVGEDGGTRPSSAGTMRPVRRTLRKSDFVPHADDYYLLVFEAIARYAANTGPKLGQGNTADVYAREPNQIIKLFHSHLAEPLAEHEWKISRKVADLQLPVPQVYGIETVDGRPGIVYEKIDGPTMMEELVKDPGSAARYGTLMAELHAGIHRKPGTGLPGQKEALERCIRHAPLLSPEQKDGVLSVLDRLPAANFVCHGDFHPGNILLAEKKPVVIDWTGGTCGNPLGDAARTAFLLKHAALPDHMPESFRSRIEQARILLFEAYLRTYMALTGCTLGQIAEWELPVMAARLAESVPDREKRAIVSQIEFRLRHFL